MSSYGLEEQMQDFRYDTDLARLEEREAATEGLSPIPIWPSLLQVSGLYEYRKPFAIPHPIPVPIPSTPVPGAEAEALSVLLREEIRLDVDGRYPQMTVSGTRYSLLAPMVHWIARLTATGPNKWHGTIWYKDGGAFSYTQIKVTAKASLFLNQRNVTIAYDGGGGAPFSRTYSFKSRSFHPVEFEFDTVKGATAVTNIATCDHPNRPPGLPCENLSVETVFRRAGFSVTKSGGDSIIPIGEAGVNARWSDMEMHDAMQTYWSRFANKAQWSLWVLFASLHESGTSLGGIMFDDIGPNHRQGTAIFSDAFISNPPTGDPAPPAWVARMRFWTACHEMGHAFNLAHSWQKSLGAPYGTPWIPLVDEPEARSFMNYPYNVSGGQAAFFADFEYRFSDGELLFMRHAPARFVQMGNADWYDHHGFEQALVQPAASLMLTAGVNRPDPVYAYLEPPVIELELTNMSDQPEVVRSDILDHADGMIVIIKRRGSRARQWVPYARHCARTQPSVLMPGQSLRSTLFAAAGRNGWDLAEPGVYTVQVAIERGEKLIVSNALTLKVRPPHDREEEVLAQDVCNDDVGRVLTFSGTRVLDHATAVLEEVTKRMKDHPLARYAHLALGRPLMRDYKLLTLADGPPQEQLAAAADVGARIKIAKADQKVAREHLRVALAEDQDAAIAALGHEGFARQMTTYAAWLDETGDKKAGKACHDDMVKLLKAHRADAALVREVSAAKA